MSGFTKDVTKTYEFDGDSVAVTFSRLIRADMIKLAPVIPEDSESSMSISESMNMLEVAAGILPERIKSVTGLFNAANEAITVETMLEETYFTSLVSDILSDMISESFVVEEDEIKN